MTVHDVSFYFQLLASISFLHVRTQLKRTKPVLGFRFYFYFISIYRTVDYGPRLGFVVEFQIVLILMDAMSQT